MTHPSNAFAQPDQRSGWWPFASVMPSISFMDGPMRPANDAMRAWTQALRNM